MPKLKAFKILFSLTALLFVAKPFIGFSAFNKQARPRISHTILVKSFTKRKPESLDEAYAQARTLRQLISDPPLILLPTIWLLMAILLPLAIENISRLTKKVIVDIRTALLPPEQVYLLAGKLII